MISNRVKQNLNYRIELHKQKNRLKNETEEIPDEINQAFKDIEKNIINNDAIENKFIDINIPEIFENKKREVQIKRLEERKRLEEVEREREREKKRIEEVEREKEREKEVQIQRLEDKERKRLEEVKRRSLEKLQRDREERKIKKIEFERNIEDKKNIGGGRGDEREKGEDLDRVKRVIKSNQKFENITKTRLYDLYAKFLFITFVLKYDFTNFKKPQQFDKDEGAQFRYFLDVGGDILMHKYVSPETILNSFSVFKNFLVLNHPSIDITKIPNIQEHYWSDFQNLVNYRFTIVQKYIQNYAKIVLYEKQVYYKYVDIINKWTFPYYNTSEWEKWRTDYSKDSDIEFKNLTNIKQAQILKSSRKKLYKIITNPENKNIIKTLINKK